MCVCVFLAACQALSQRRTGEGIPEEAKEEVGESLESGLTTQSPLGELEESLILKASGALPKSIHPVEELAKLQPRIDPRPCPSPG